MTLDLYFFRKRGWWLQGNGLRQAGTRAWCQEAVARIQVRDPDNWTKVEAVRMERWGRIGDTEKREAAGLEEGWWAEEGSRCFTGRVPVWEDE